MYVESNVSVVMERMPFGDSLTMIENSRQKTAANTDPFTAPKTPPKSLLNLPKINPLNNLLIILARNITKTIKAKNSKNVTIVLTIFETIGIKILSVM